MEAVIGHQSLDHISHILEWLFRLRIFYSLTQIGEALVQSMSSGVFPLRRELDYLCSRLPYRLEGDHRLLLLNLNNQILHRGLNNVYHNMMRLLPLNLYRWRLVVGWDLGLSRDDVGRHGWSNGRRRF